MAETIYEKASKIIQDRKEKRENEIKRRRLEVFEIIPRVKEIEEELDRYGIRMLNLIANGECDEESAVKGIMEQNKAFVKEREELLKASSPKAATVSGILMLDTPLPSKALQAITTVPSLTV